MSEPSFRVVITAIIEKSGRFLVTQRASSKKRFPDLWTVPGGGIEEEDFKDLPKNKDGVQYHVLEKALEREILQEVGLRIHNLRYIGSMVLDNAQVFVVSIHADYLSGEVTLNEESQNFRWVTLSEAKELPLIDGIYNELEIAAYEEKR